MTSFRPLESRRRAQGFEIIAGIDEVGRGAWAGPLVAAAVILRPYARLPGIRDSKKLSASQRQRFALRVAAGALAIGYGVVSQRDIDAHGISAANQEAFRRAVASLAMRPSLAVADYFSVAGGVCAIEGIRGGDEHVRVIAAASVLAKVYRDALMDEVDRVWPVYGFRDHKGYGTATHRRAIARFGPSPWHRHSFALFG